MMRLLSVIGHIIRELSAVIMAVFIGIFFFSGWEIEFATQEEAIFYSFMAAIFLFAYLWLQSGGIALTGVPNSLAMATDAIFSIIPLIPLLFAFFEYAGGDLQMSYFQFYFGIAMLVALLFDVVVNLTLMIRLSRRYLGESGLE
ncbi:hypothetical protein [Dichotomicrobium thermohalophilum]|uniref:ABC transporter permease n=1 Tax=Dichotomicrobium thermohalophilum TaxID=933063 RepID=A0A397Q872_9HYPH|nr:hypothetical protein [Dichotomicrobium thermohalophilum]RIA56025.1 hypothetical protein BXY53_1116 [Dichotomicrobium thermohalophilum]